MIPHRLATGESEKCAVCGRAVRGAAQRVVGLGTVCMGCGLEKIRCDSCGEEVKRITVTRLRGRFLCLKCYSKERESGVKRMSRTINGTIQEAVQRALVEAPEGFVLIGLKLSHNSKSSWVAEYEREDVFMMRCS